MVIAGIIYKRSKSRRSALWGSIAGAVGMAVISLPLNYFLVYPAYVVCYGMPMEAVVGMATKAVPFVDTEWKLLLCVTAPFNLLKGVLVSLLTFFLYKRVEKLFFRKKHTA